MVTFDFKKTPITQIADFIIVKAAKSNSSDIHFDPRENGLMVRIRIDGELQDYALIPESYERNLITRLKLLANMNITESRLPQDGAIKGKIGDLDLDMRVSSLPTNEGEKVVIRILDYSRSLSGMDSLGFSAPNFKKLERMIQVPNGIILITGATGTGKSTTVYSILQELNKEETNIITVEDPIEMNIEGLNQVQVNSDIGLDFATVLRSILRQDPNIILIGEIRDSETAKIAVRASITGHLVLSTIHTNNSLSTIERLLDMNVERYLLSSALTGIISQRLAKMLCKKCRIERETTLYEKKVFKIALEKDVDKIYDANHEGCDECKHGYKGRIAIQEVLEIDDEVRDALNDPTLIRDDLKELVYTCNVITMLQDGLGKILDGSTSFEEIYKIIDIDDDINNNYNRDVNSEKSDNVKKYSRKKITEENKDTEKQELENILVKEDNSVISTPLENTTITPILDNKEEIVINNQNIPLNGVTNEVPIDQNLIQDKPAQIENNVTLQENMNINLQNSTKPPIGPTVNFNEKSLDIPITNIDIKKSAPTPQLNNVKPDSIQTTNK